MYHLSMIRNNNIILHFSSGNEGRIFIILLVLLVALTMTLVGLQIFYIYHRVREHNRRLTAYHGTR